MIFVTIGTHDQEFTRLIRRIDEIAPLLREKVVVQRGFTRYVPKHCESFEFTSNIDTYFKKARLVIAHGASTTWEFLYNYRKPLIVVPRLKKFDEHINDHQAEFGAFLEKKTGVKSVINISDLDETLLRSYTHVVTVDDANLRKLRSFVHTTLETWQKQLKDHRFC